ncbi:MAG: NAD(+) diphosphatase [Gammaproteobacteria bacterium]|nr:NAD(+) diphosphatase [Gammaproteobacteria bacterium]
MNVTFTNSGIDRCGELRTDVEALRSALALPDTRIVGIRDQRCLVDDDRARLLTIGELGLGAGDLPNLVLLGRRDGHYLFARRIDDALTHNIPDQEFRALREVVSDLNAPDAALIAYARAMIIWHQRHAYCGSCGSRNRSAEAGFVMACTAEGCGQRSFPRLDPAVIVLVHRGDRCLMGRQTTWPAGRFSTIAGFVEPGESLEDAVRREVHEETGIEVGDCSYLASQPWPFPAALMIGFHAQALSEDIRLVDGELAEARWLTREQIIAGEVTLPPETSVAFRLIEAWFDQGPGRNLAELGITGPPLRIRRSGDRA